MKIDRDEARLSPIRITSLMSPRKPGEEAVRKDSSGSPESLLLTVLEAARLLRISRNLAYVLVAQGRLPHIRLGRRVLVPRRGLEIWLAQEAGLPLEPPAVASLPGQRR
jgi:excisionase family DNA binding protein